MAPPTPAKGHNPSMAIQPAVVDKIFFQRAQASLTTHLLLALMNIDLSVYKDGADSNRVWYSFVLEWQFAVGRIEPGTLDDASDDDYEAYMRNWKGRHPAAVPDTCWRSVVRLCEQFPKSVLPVLRKISEELSDDRGEHMQQFENRMDGFYCREPTGEKTFKDFKSEMQLTFAAVATMSGKQFLAMKLIQYCEVVVERGPGHPDSFPMTEVEDELKALSSDWR